MAHEIMEHDNIVLHKNAAWHGLGIIVQDAPTPREALHIAGLGWGVVQAPCVAKLVDGGELVIPKTMCNFRSDTKDVLGVVTDNYRPVQNTELADFCEALAENGDQVKIESAGSIRNGQKVWFLLKGESFSIRGKDEIAPYICVSNGHDGWTALRCTPTTVRVVCSNTLHMVIPQKDFESRPEKVTTACFVAHHTKTIMDRVEEAKAALQLYGRALDTTRQVIDQLAAREVKREEIQQFFLECYTRDFGPIPVNPTTKVEQNARDRAMEVCNAVFAKFDEERDLAGTTAWNMFNAYTNFTQHRPSRMKDQAKAADRRLDSKLFGTEAQRAYDSLRAALTIAC